MATPKPNPVRLDLNYQELHVLDKMMRHADAIAARKLELDPDNTHHRREIDAMMESSVEILRPEVSSTLKNASGLVNDNTNLSAPGVTSTNSSDELQGPTASLDTTDEVVEEIIRELESTGNNLEEPGWHLLQSDWGQKPKQAFCRRVDGLVLSMSIAQYQHWRRSQQYNKRLQALCTEHGRQIEGDVLLLDDISMRYLHNASVLGNIGGQNKKPEDSKIQELTTGAVHLRSGDEGSPCPCCGTLPGQQLGNAESNTNGLTHYYPPCYCSPCSQVFWRPQGFGETISRAEAAEEVSKWVLNATAKAHNLHNILRENERALRRRWEKKKLGQRRALLLGAHPEMLTHKHLARLTRYNTRLSNHKKQSSATDHLKRANLLTNSMLLEDLVRNSETLFDHLRVRSEFPTSRFFLADLLRLEAGILLEPSIRTPYIFGTFITTEADYGKWAEWCDDAVHRFEAVAAPCSYHVFESQSMTLDVLSSILEALMHDTQTSTILEVPLRSAIHVAPPRTLQLPNVFEFESIFMSAVPPCFTLDDIISLARDRTAKVVSDLRNLRNDNHAFVERLKTGRSFFSAIGNEILSTDAWLVYQVMIVPHERALFWLSVEETLTNLLNIQVSELENRITFARAFKRIQSALELAGAQIRLKSQFFCYGAVKPQALVPRMLLGSEPNITLWLKNHFFDHLWSPGRLLRATLVQQELNGSLDEIPYISDILKEWIEDFCTMRRVTEVLFQIEPMIRAYLMEYENEIDTLWYKLVPSNHPEAFAEHVERLGGKMKDILKTARHYTLPTGVQNTAFWEKDLNARRLLRDTWEDYIEACLEYYASTNFPSSWLESIEKVMVITEPTDMPLTPMAKPNSVQTPKSHIKEDFFTPSLIPHQSGLETPTARKITKKKRDQLNPTPWEDSDSDDEQTKVEPQVASFENPSTEKIKIPVKKHHLNVVESLFSNAQQNVSSVRWPRFEKFMQDAGLHMHNGEGASIVFSGKNVVNGQKISLVTHRPHPDSTLKATHLRNNRMKIVELFGWQKEMFVARE